MTEILLVDRDKRGVATVTLNRADKHNAFNAELITAIREAFETLATDDACRVIVLRAKGKNFCAGADLAWMREAAKYSESENQKDAANLSAMLAAIAQNPKPVVALAQGAVFGGGVGLVCCADIVIASPEATFALSEVRLGLIPATIAPFVIAAIGARQARRYFLTAERIDTTTALRIGLVHDIAEDLDGANAAVLSELLAGGPKAMTGAKKLNLDYANRPIDDELRADSVRRIAKRRSSSEAQEGLAAFFEKRKPRWAASDDGGDG